MNIEKDLNEIQEWRKSIIATRLLSYLGKEGYSSSDYEKATITIDMIEGEILQPQKIMIFKEKQCDYLRGEKFVNLIRIKVMRLFEASKDSPNKIEITVFSYEDYCVKLY